MSLVTFLTLLDGTRSSVCRVDSSTNCFGHLTDPYIDWTHESFFCMGEQMVFAWLRFRWQILSPSPLYGKKTHFWIFFVFLKFFVIFLLLIFNLPKSMYLVFKLFKIWYRLTFPAISWIFSIYRGCSAGTFNTQLFLVWV